MENNYTAIASGVPCGDSLSLIRYNPINYQF
jgi:hypothetical protein